MIRQVGAVGAQLLGESGDGDVSFNKALVFDPSFQCAFHILLRTGLVPSLHIVLIFPFKVGYVQDDEQAIKEDGKGYKRNNVKYDKHGEQCPAGEKQH